MTQQPPPWGKHSALPVPINPNAKMPAWSRILFEKQWRYISVRGGRGSGKCLGKGTRLIRADGSLIAVEDVQRGDALLGPDGKPRFVLGTTRGMGPLYRVTQKTGMTYICNDAHILVLERGDSAIAENRYDYLDTGKGYSLITATRYANETEAFKTRHFGFRRAIIGQHLSLPIDPYLLGLWLGDGTSLQAEITTVDTEIVEYLEEISVANGWSITIHEDAPGRASRYGISNNWQHNGKGFYRALCRNNLIGNKHIPEVYFGASEEQRWQLLSGLVDTDGYVMNGCVEISQSREYLLDQIIRLAHGLGLKASKTKKYPVCNGTPCVAWRTMLGGDLDKLSLRIARKRAEIASLSKNKDWRRTRIDVEPIGIGEYFGFELSGDHLFMLEDGTITHNTKNFARALVMKSTERKLRVLCTREVQLSIRDSVYANVVNEIRELGLERDFDILSNEIRSKRHPGGMFIFRGLAAETIDSIKSMADIDIAWVEEAQSVSRKSLQLLFPTIRADDSQIWFSWNPILETDPIYELVVKEGLPMCASLFVNFDQNPWFPKVLQLEEQHMLGRNPTLHKHVWLGYPLAAIEGAIFFDEIVEMEREERTRLLTIDPLIQPYAVFDLGFDDAMTCGIIQTTTMDFRIVDYMENNRVKLSWFDEELRGRGYENAVVVFPHDGRNKNLQTAQSPQELMQEYGWVVDICDNVGVENGIRLTRETMPYMYVDRVRCEQLLEHLKRYRRNKYGHPQHDEHSHACDMVRYACVHRPLMDTSFHGGEWGASNWGRELEYPRITTG